MTPIWLLVSFGIEFALLAFSVTVAIFVAVQRAKRRPLFSSAFFAIYLLESVIGCAHYVVVGSLYTDMAKASTKGKHFLGLVA